MGYSLNTLGWNDIEKQINAAAAAPGAEALEITLGLGGAGTIAVINTDGTKKTFTPTREEWARLIPSIIRDLEERMKTL